MLKRDVNNMKLYYGQFAPELLTTKFADEIWALYAAGDFDAEAELTGEFIESNQNADVDAVLEEIKAAFAQMQERQLRQQQDDEDLYWCFLAWVRTLSLASIVVRSADAVGTRRIV